MWTSTLDLKLKQALITRLLGLVYPNIYYSPLSPLRVANIPRATLPVASWVRVRNRLAGISGSDLPLVHANIDVRSSVAALPHNKAIYPGHEVVGEVIEIGEDVQHLHVGDRVVLQYGPNCLSSGAKPLCRACSMGNYNHCEYGPLPGPQPIGGGWSEEMLLHEQQLFRLPDELSDEQGVMLEPTAIALHAILRHLPEANDNVLVIGAGTIGLLTLHLLHTLVPKAHISIFARYPFQIEYATRLGADHIIYPIDPYTSVQRATHAQLYKGMLGNRTILGGYDVIYDTVGQQNTLHHGLRWLRTQGTMVLVGLNPQHMVYIDPTPIWHQEVNLLGSLSHGREIWPRETAVGTSTFSVVTELMQQKRIQPEQLITHRFALNTYKDALLTLKRKRRSQAVKVIFDHALLPASAVPNVRASARLRHPELAQPQGNAFREEVEQAQDTVGSQQDPAQEAILQSKNAQQTFPPKILDTPLPQALPNETWESVLDKQDTEEGGLDEDTSPTIPVVRAPFRSSVSSRVVEPPQTPMPPALEPTPTLAVETPGTDESEANSHSAQPAQEPQQAEAVGNSSLLTDESLSQFPVELPANEDVPISSFPETRGMNAVTEEQLPTQTVLDNLFDTDTSSMPEFLAQLSNFDALNVPVTPISKAEDVPFSGGGMDANDEIFQPDARSEVQASGELADDLVLPDSGKSTDGGMTAATSGGLADDLVLPAGSIPAVPTENAEAFVWPDPSIAAVPLDAVDETDVLSTTTKVKARKKRKAAGSDQTTTNKEKEE